MGPDPSTPYNRTGSQLEGLYRLSRLLIQVAGKESALSKLIGFLANARRQHEIWLQEDSGHQSLSVLWYQAGETEQPQGGVTLSPEMTRELAETLDEFPNSSLTLAPLVDAPITLESVKESLSRIVEVPFRGLKGRRVASNAESTT